ncbi:pyruvate dehydrogenase E1 component beta subunit [Deltaproteobacteria bacterium]|nr:pyruvate dehydrogenase E1 component beta subunit [Deltaproteobacteria bacterium]
MRTGRDQLRAALAAHAASPNGVLVGEAVGVAGLSKGVTGNLLRTPLSEAGSVGAAAGLALAGKRPVVELIDPAGVARAAEALGEAAALGIRSNGTFNAALVALVVLPDDGTLPVAPPGVLLAVAGVASDAAGMLLAAIAANRPVLVVVTESSLDSRGEADTTALSEPVVRRAGTGLTVLAEGAGVALALSSTEGVEVVDLRGCRDPKTIAALAARTGRVVLVGHGDPSPLAAVSEQAFWRLEARPLSIQAAAGASALAAAISDSFTP